VIPAFPQPHKNINHCRVAASRDVPAQAPHRGRALPRAMRKEVPGTEEVGLGALAGPFGTASAAAYEYTNPGRQSSKARNLESKTFSRSPIKLSTGRRHLGGPAEG